MLSIMNVTEKKAAEVHFHKCYCPIPAAKKCLNTKRIFLFSPERYHTRFKKNSCKKRGGERGGEGTQQKIVIIIFYHHLFPCVLLFFVSVLLLLEFAAAKEKKKNWECLTEPCAQYMRFLHNNKRKRYKSGRNVHFFFFPCFCC